MSTQSRPEPESGTPIYTVRVQLDVPSHVDTAALGRRLQAIAEELQVELTFARPKNTWVVIGYRATVKRSTPRVLATSMSLTLGWLNAG